MVGEPVLLDVFVYGTLKQGQRNHERFCHRGITMREATVRGRLYDLPLGFPALVVPRADIHATGTGDYPGDARLQARTRPGPQRVPPGWGTVHGELLTFDDPEQRLPALDGLEGFHPGEEDFYERVLIPATLVQTGTTLLAWAYATRSETGIYLPGGRWPAA